MKKILLFLVVAAIASCNDQDPELRAKQQYEQSKILPKIVKDTTVKH